MTFFGILLAIIACKAVMDFLVARPSWQMAAREVGLEEDPENSFKLHGKIRGFDVEVAVNEDLVSIDVVDVDPGFTLGRLGAVARVLSTDIRTGDSDFDRRIQVEGDADLALAILDYETRRAADLVIILSEHGEVSSGRIRCMVKGLTTIPSSVDAVLDLAEALRRPPLQELPGRLARNVLEDPSLGVRLQSLRQLASSFSRSRDLTDTARTLRSSNDAPLKMEACRALLREPAPEGAEAAEELAMLARRHHVAPSIRRRSIEAVVRSEFRDVAIPVMVAILQDLSSPSDVRLAALDGLAEAGAQDELLNATVSEDAAESVHLARALARLGKTAQPLLLELLGHSGADVRSEAARSLGRVGDLSSVAALRAVAGKGTLIRSAVARAAEHAIGEIKGRYDGSQGGEISLAGVEPLEGAVSPADDSEAGGEVSLAS